KDAQAAELPQELRGPPRPDAPQHRRPPRGRTSDVPTWQRNEAEDIQALVPALLARPPRPKVHGIAEGEGAPSRRDGERSGVVPLRRGGVAVLGRRSLDYDEQQVGFSV